MTAVSSGPAPSAIDAEPAVQGAGVVTTVEGATFCVSDSAGNVDPGAAQGLFFRDTRIISCWRLRVGGALTQVLAVMPRTPYATRFVGRVPPKGTQTELLLERTRYVGNGMREDLRLRNLGHAPVAVTLTLEVGADFADLFAVKEDRVETADTFIQPDGSSVTLITGDADQRRGVHVEAQAANASPEGLRFEVEVPAGGQWRTSVLVRPRVAGRELATDFPLGQPPDQSAVARALRTWQENSPRAEIGDVDLARTLRRSVEDLGSLRVADPENPGSVAVAAGAPWFMAVFGRDSLLSSYMALPLDPTLALGTLQTLARAQGTKVDPRTEEQPGRILHETRFGLDFPLARGGGSVYYGTADATPLFVVVLGELSRWGIDTPDKQALLEHADRALAWVEDYGDRDGDGFVEYERMTEHGLVNQGWKDSFDGITFADGTIATPPIALCEVQGYVYAAYVARSHFAHEAGDEAAAGHWTAKARALKDAFNERFWLQDLGWYALGLDRDKRPIDALASNMGHCLWTGIVDVELAPRVAERLLSPEMFSGWGVRTLATSMRAYNPMSYHNGSVWPHDSALIAAGLMRYGFVDEAQRIATGLLDAAVAFDGRLPELFCGFDRRDFPKPLPYPTSCSPQAWAAATPIQLVRSLLRLDPWMSRREVWFAPAWPERLGSIRIEHLPLAGHRAALHVDGRDATMTGLPADVSVIHEPRAPLVAGAPA